MRIDSTAIRTSAEHLNMAMALSPVPITTAGLMPISPAAERQELLGLDDHILFLGGASRIADPGSVAISPDVAHLLFPYGEAREQVPALG